MKFNKNMVIKVVGLVLSIGGTIATGYATQQDNKENLEKFVKENLNKSGEA